MLDSRGISLMGGTTLLDKMQFSSAPSLIISQTSRKNQAKLFQLWHRALMEGSYRGSVTPG